eukprot:scaffold47594_cov60-Phaeocystis_antarctica.AAC.1
MTAAEQAAASIKFAVTAGTDSAGDATYTFRSTQENNGENNPTNFTDLAATTPTTAPDGGQTLMQQQAIQLNFLGKTSFVVTLAVFWSGADRPINFKDEIANPSVVGGSGDVGDGSDGVDDNDGKYPRATARLFRFTGNIVASPSPPPSPPPASPSPSSAGDDPTFIGSDGAAYHVCIAAVPPMHPCDAASQLPAHNQAVCQPNAHAAHEFLSTRTVLCTRPPFPTSPPRLP